MTTRVMHAKSKMAWAPWTDKKGRLHPLRAVTFALLLLPGLWLAFRFGNHMLGPRPLNTAIHSTGYWAISFLVACLIVTPAKAFLGMPNFAVIRRMIGNAALAYALIHLVLYSADQGWNLITVVREIAVRFYLTIGFVALVGLSVLGWTSTDGWAQRLGRDWKKLHRLVYALTVLGLIHFILQTKADVSLPLLFVGTFFWLMIWRLLPAGRDRGPVAILGVTIAAAPLTGIAEWNWYRFGTHIDPNKMLLAEFDVGFGLGPVGQVLLFGLLTLVALRLRAMSQGRAGESPLFWVLVFALGAVLHELIVFVFGIDRFLEPGDLSYLYQDFAWAGLLGILGFVRWRAGDTGYRHAIDGLGLACVAFQITLSSNGVRGAGIVLAVAIASLWTVLAWQSWPRTKLAALSLLPVCMALAYGVSELT